MRLALWRNASSRVGRDDDGPLEHGGAALVPRWLARLSSAGPSVIVLALFWGAAILSDGGGPTTAWWWSGGAALAVAYAIRGRLPTAGLSVSLAVVGATRLPGVDVIDSAFDARYLLVLLVPILPLAAVASRHDARWSWLAALAAAAVTALVSPDPPWSAPDYSAQQVVARYVLDLGVPSALAVLAWLAGYALRTRQRYADAAWRRASSLEQTKDAEMANAISRERNQIARELHDVITHGVAVMVVQASAADAVWDRDPAQARDSLRAVEESGRVVMGELREMLAAIRGDEPTPAMRHAQPALAEIHTLADRIEAAGTRARVVASGDLDRVPPALALSLLRVAQESVTNALRHARATSIVIELEIGRDVVRLAVTDDGIGIGAADDRPELVDAGGGGLIGMRERAAAVDGTLRITAPPGGGTRIAVDAPLGIEALT